MNAQEQLAASIALDRSGLRFLKPIRDGAKIVGWETVAPGAVLGRILAAFGWRVELVGRGEEAHVPLPTTTVALLYRHLTLVR